MNENGIQNQTTPILPIGMLSQHYPSPRMLRMASGLMKMEMSIRTEVITLAYFPHGRNRSRAHYDEEKAKRCHSLL
jgi:hypothetical protein